MIVYLDNASTTQPLQEVIEEMTSSLSVHYANPSSTHILGKTTKNIINEARSSIANILGVESECCLFTSGGTESNNLAILGAARAARARTNKNHIAMSNIEHKSVFRAFDLLRNEGFEVSIIPVDKKGIVQVSSVQNVVQDNTCLVSVMLVNNETGVIQPVKQIAEYLSLHDIIFHTDAVQAFGKIQINLSDSGVNLASFAAHKIHGPKGLGMLYVSKDTPLQSYIVGGQQEFGLRAGTENIVGIVGFAKAAQLANDYLQNNGTDKIRSLRHLFVEEIMNDKEIIDLIKINNDLDLCVPHILNMRINVSHGQVLHRMLRQKGLCISSGSACSNISQEPSYVLLSQGLTIEQAESSARISLSRLTTKDDIKMAATIFKQALSIMKHS